MKRISKTKRLISYIALEIDEYNNNLYPKYDGVDYDYIESLRAQYNRIRGLVLALNIVSGKSKYYIGSDAEYGSMIGLHKFGEWREKTK